MSLFHRYFERHSLAFPEKKAVCVDGRCVTYRELLGMARLVANTLRQGGAATGDRVALCADVSAEAIAAALGIMKAGCVLASISPLSEPRQFLDHLNDCGARVLVTNNRVDIGLLLAETDVQSVIPVGHAATALDGRFNSEGDADAADEGSACLDDEALGAIFYTSGSTGTPKGILVSHRNMVAAFRSVISYLENTADDIVLSFTPSLSSDYGFYNTMMPLLFGGTAVVQSRLPETAEAMLTLLRREGVTGLQVFPPAVFRLVDVECVAAIDLPRLRYISSSGDVLPLKYIARLRTAFPNIKIFSNYGMTECKRIAYLPPEQIDRRPASVGKAIPGLRTFLVDEKGSFVTEPGFVGELAVTGGLVMQRYWNKPDLTARVLKDFGGHRDMFFTGDLFRMDEEGFLYFVCRKKEVFYRNAQPVNPREIESLLLAHPCIAEAAVVPLHDELRGILPKACVVLKRGARASAQELIQFCADALSPHCVPADVEFYASLPRTFGGKASRPKLGSAVAAEPQR